MQSTQALSPSEAQPLSNLLMQQETTASVIHLGGGGDRGHEKTGERFSVNSRYTKGRKPSHPPASRPGKFIDQSSKAKQERDASWISWVMCHECSCANDQKTLHLHKPVSQLKQITTTTAKQRDHLFDSSSIKSINETT